MSLPIEDADSFLTATADPAKLAKVIELSRDLLRISKRIGELEKQLEEQKAGYSRLAEKVIPDALLDCGLSELDLGGGWRIETNPFFNANLPSPSGIEKAKGEEQEELIARLEAGLGWLAANSGDAIVSKAITIKLKKGQTEQERQIRELLASLKLNSDIGAKVHHATLANFLKEKIGKGVEVPFDTFAVHAGTVAKLVPPPNQQPNKQKGKK
jgi:hypothetical protein